MRNALAIAIAAALAALAALLLAEAAPSLQGSARPKQRRVLPSQTAPLVRHPGRGGGGGGQLRVVNGRDAVLGQFPWQALIAMDGSFICGGSLVSDSFVLTAAQCASGYLQFKVVVGEIDIRFFSSPALQYGFTYQAIVHDDYEEDRMANDIALVKMLRPFKLTEGVTAPVRLPSSADASNTFVGQSATITGWGDEWDFVLEYVAQPVMDSVRCARFFGTYEVDGTPVVNAAIHLCGDGDGVVGACSDDAGGALVIQEADGSWKQIGISSFESDLGCKYGYPSVYTRVTAYLDWIARNTQIAL